MIFLITVFLSLLLSTANAATMTHGPAVGTVTSTSARFFARTDAGASVDFEYSVNSNLTSSVVSSTVSTASGSDYTGQVTVSGLSANTVYYYTPRVDTVRSLSSPYATFKTAPAAGVDAEFEMGFITDFVLANSGACDSVDSGVFNSLDADNPDFVFVGGDLDHRNVSTLGESRTMHKDNYDISKVCRADYVTNILRRYWIDHTLSDHDFGVNDSNKNDANKANSLQAFDEYFPVARESSYGLWHKTSYANADFWVLDTRSQRDPNTDADDANKSMLDGDNLGLAGQLEWLKVGLLNSTARWNFIITDIPWNPSSKPVDSWGAFTTERNALIDYFKQHGIRRLIFLSADVHFAAYDGGQNSGYPEMVITHADNVACNTAGNPYIGTWKYQWGNDSYTNGCWGYGLIEIKTNPHRVVLHGKDENGGTLIDVTIPYERLGVTRSTVTRGSTVNRSTVSAREIQF